jgi:hypothetical protein
MAFLSQVQPGATVPESTFQPRCRPPERHPKQAA